MGNSDVVNDNSVLGMRKRKRARHSSTAAAASHLHPSARSHTLIPTTRIMFQTTARNKRERNRDYSTWDKPTSFAARGTPSHLVEELAQPRLRRSWPQHELSLHHDGPVRLSPLPPRLGIERSQRRSQQSRRVPAPHVPPSVVVGGSSVELEGQGTARVLRKSPTGECAHGGFLRGGGVQMRAVEVGTGEEGKRKGGERPDPLPCPRGAT